MTNYSGTGQSNGLTYTYARTMLQPKLLTKNGAGRRLGRCSRARMRRCWMSWRWGCRWRERVPKRCGYFTRITSSRDTATRPGCRDLARHGMTDAEIVASRYRLTEA